MEYLKVSRDYFWRFRQAHLKDYLDIMNDYNVGRSTGYQYFYRSDEVVQTIRDIYHNLEEYYSNISIPEGFATPRALVESWVRFRQMLISRAEVFSDILDHLKIEREKLPFYSEEENIYDYLPEPLVQIDAVRHEMIDLLDHILSIDEVTELLNSHRDVTRFSETVTMVELICRNFHRFCLQLLRRYSGRLTISVSDEYDVQDLLHSIFKIHYNDVRAEEYTPSYAGGSSRIDFLLAEEAIAVEIKKTRSGLKGKEVGEQLLIDIGRYSSHPKCKTLICFVYDPDFLIINPQGIETDLSKSNGSIDVKVIVAPKGT